MLLLFLAAAVPALPAPDPDRLDQCLSEIATGSSEALADLYRQTRASVYSFSLSLLKNAEDAEDVLHDCYIQIFLAADTYQSLGKPLAWILTIAKNLCRKKLREQARTTSLPEEDWLDTLPAPKQLEPEERILLRSCLTRLSDEEQQIVVLHAVSGFRHREIADLLSLPLSTVLSKYNRAIKKLQRYLREEGSP